MPRCNMFSLTVYEDEMAQKSGFNLLHRADIIKIIDGVIEAARLAQDEAAVKWLSILRGMFER